LLEDDLHYHLVTTAPRRDTDREAEPRNPVPVFGTLHGVQTIVLTMADTRREAQTQRLVISARDRFAVDRI
jgi:hypothetical protein